MSTFDPSLKGLPIVPLTMSVEMLAEVAQALFQNMVVTGVVDVRARRWIALDRERLTLRLEAKRKPNGPPLEVAARIFFGGDSEDGAAVDAPVVEATVVLEARYPQRPGTHRRGDRAQAARPSGDLYSDVMFHGPALQGVKSIDWTDSDGIGGTLSNPPDDLLFRDIRTPHFLTDPVLLDAAGQLVGYWSAEQFDEGFHVFPFRVESIELFGPPMRPGEAVECYVGTQVIGDVHIRSDIEIVSGNGLHARLLGWWDRRFTLPDALYRLRIAPRDVLLAERSDVLLPAHRDFSGWTACRLCSLSPEFLEGHGAIWLRVLVSLALGRRERETWHRLDLPMGARIGWLLGRVAAKDAVRQLLRARGLSVCPSDIAIEDAADGRMVARGAWADAACAAPLVSISQAGSYAAAIAAD